MRKFCLLAAAIFVLTLTSCSAGMSLGIGVPDFEKSYAFTADMEYGGNSTATGDFARTNVNAWEGTLTAPYSLQGVAVSYAPNTLTLSFAGFAITHELNNLSGLDFDYNTGDNVRIALMFKALEHAFNSKSAATEADKVNISAGRDFIEVTGNIDGDVYILTLDKAGLPTSLEIPSKQFKAAFTNVTANDFPAADLTPNNPPSDLAPDIQ